MFVESYVGITLSNSNLRDMTDPIIEIPRSQSAAAGVSALVIRVYAL